MTNPDRHYRTEAGSHVRVFGRYYGCYEIDWDWLAEGACDTATPSADTSNPADAWLVWSCVCCDYGQARLVAVVNAPSHD